MNDTEVYLDFGAYTKQVHTPPPYPNSTVKVSNDPNWYRVTGHHLKCRENEEGEIVVDAIFVRLQVTELSRNDTSVR